MAMVVFDDFNRANDPTSLGTATTGQTWSLVHGDFPFGILGNQAYWNRTGAGDRTARAVLCDRLVLQP